MALRRIDRPFYGLQYLRALAVLMVLIVHAFQLKAGMVVTILASGVDMFFVLSGFLMIAITDEHSRPVPFALARIRRIVPLYWLVTTITVVMLWGGVSVSSPIPFRHLAQYWNEFPLGLIAASYLFVPWWNEAAGLIQPIVPLGWTLNLEVLFYALMAVSLLVPRRRQFTMLLVTVGALAAAGMLDLFSAPALSGWTDPIVLDFLVGAWLGTAWQHGKSLWNALLIAAIILCAIAAGQALTGDLGSGDGRYILAVPCGLVLTWVLWLEDRPGGVPYAAFPLLLGNSSYAIYLVQFPVALGLGMAGIHSGPLFTVGLLVGALVIGCVTYQFLETRIMAWGKGGPRQAENRPDDKARDRA